MIRPEIATKLTVVDSVPAEPIAERVCQALDEFLSALQAGHPPDVEDWLRQYSDIASILRDQLDGLLALQTAAQTAGPAADLLQDPRLIDAFRLRREIGRGGMGVVFEADDTALGRRVALKILPFAAVLDQKQLTRFQNEAQAASRLHHPHIVPVYSVGCDRGVHYYAMQYINGRSLEDAIGELQQQQATGLVPVDAATCSWRWDGDGRPATSREFFRRLAELGRDVASGLQHAHELGVLHRDIKPSNLLLDAAGKVWITDFGLARLPGEVSVTCTGEVLGSARYMSPEQAAGRKAFVDHRTDVYSLGITLYELATLRPAFATESRAQFLQHVQNLDPVLPRRLNPFVPLSLQAIICRAMEKDPRRRYGTAREMAEDLQRFLESRVPLARKTQLRDRLRRWTDRHRFVLRAVAAMLVLGVIGTLSSGIIIWRAYDEARSQYQTARSAVDRFGATMSRRLASIPGAYQVRKDLLAETLAYYRGFIQHAKHDESLWRDVGDAYLQIGRIHEQLGEIDQACAAYDTACRTLGEIRRRHRNDLPSVTMLAQGLNNRGLMRAELGELEPGLRDVTQAVDLLQQLQRERPADRSLLADLACALSNRALILADRQQWTKAVADLEAAVTQQRFLTAASPQDVDLRNQLAIGLQNLASLYERRQDLERAELLAGEAIALQIELARLAPDELSYQSDLALGYNNLGVLTLRQQRNALAIRYFQSAVSLGEGLVGKAPQIVYYRRDLAVSVNNLGRSLLADRKFDEAIQQFDEAARLVQILIQQQGQRSEYVQCLDGIQHNRTLAEQQMADLRVRQDYSGSDAVVQNAAQPVAGGEQRSTEVLP